MLDDRRLGKQRVETLTIMRALVIPGYGWQHHPAVRMWRGCRPALAAYQRACCTEWQRRGFADTCLAKTLADLDLVPGDRALYDAGEIRMPEWLGDDAVHLSHRSALVRKAPEHYRPLLGDVPDDLPYVWPVPADAR